MIFQFGNKYDFAKTSEIIAIKFIPTLIILELFIIYFINQGTNI